MAQKMIRTSKPAPSARLRSIMAVSTLLILTGCQESAQKPAEVIRPVLVTTIHYKPQVVDRTLVGVVRPRIETDLGFRVAGKVARRLVEVGDVVEQGQPLAALDGVDLRLQAEQAEAEERAARGALETAAAAEERAKGLRGGGWSTDAQIELTRAAGDEARARLLRAQRTVELTKNSLSYATLLADGPGVVTATLVEPGQILAAGQTAVRVARAREREVVVSLPESLVASARDSAAFVSLWTSPDKKHAAKLRELAPSADPVTRTFLARFAISDAGDDMRLGMTATLTLSENGGTPVARVPLSALFNQGAGPSLYVVNEQANGVALKNVTVRSYGAQEVEITDGVAEGAQVVSLGVQKLDPSQKIRVVSSLAF